MEEVVLELELKDGSGFHTERGAQTRAEAEKHKVWLGISR